MTLPEELERAFLQDINQYEEERKMPYISSVERIGIEKGREQGREEGREEGIQQGAGQMLIKLLEHRFEPLPKDVKAYLHQCEVDQLNILFDLALSVDSFDEFLESSNIHIQELGALRMLRRLLRRRFESLPQNVNTRLSKYNVQQLEELLDLALTVDSLDEFVNALPVIGMRDEG
ncbi:MAG TPA: hypothetical protein DDZ80_31965, partial [Cyanobacteria bacterium UBA8803]|nr:hypothetical protein [Cyanobacteria bacterium UBA8803]